MLAGPRSARPRSAERSVDIVDFRRTRGAIPFSVSLRDYRTEGRPTVCGNASMAARGGARGDHPRPARRSGTGRYGDTGVIALIDSGPGRRAARDTRDG